MQNKRKSKKLIIDTIVKEVSNKPNIVPTEREKNGKEIPSEEIRRPEVL
jgi:hypothetical protein